MIANVAIELTTSVRQSSHRSGDVEKIVSTVTIDYSAIELNQPLRVNSNGRERRPVAWLACWLLLWMTVLVVRPAQAQAVWSNLLATGGGTVVPPATTVNGGIKGNVKVGMSGDTITGVYLFEEGNPNALTYKFFGAVTQEPPPDTLRSFDLSVPLAPGTHRLYLQANAYSGTGGTSPIFTITVANGGPQNQTITFNPIAGQTYGGTAPTLSATASSGLAVTFSSTTPSICGVSGSSATLLAAGQCTIAANQAGNASYNPAPQVTQSFNIAKANQTISFTPPASGVKGGTVTLSATSSSGLTVSYASNSTTICTVSGSTVNLLAIGDCYITASQAGNANYNAAAAVTKYFKVSGKAQTISFGTLTAKTYGDAPFAVSATASSGLPVTFSSGSTGVCTVSGNIVTLVAGGSCTINADQGGDATWAAATQVPRTFSVAKKAQTISFSVPSTSSVGSSQSLYASTSSGLTVTFTSATPTMCTVSGNTVTAIKAGTCTVNANQAGDARYLVASQVQQSFSIGKGTQSINFGALPSKTYGAAPFSISATATSGLAVSFSSGTPSICSVSGSTVTLNAMGNCAITASQAGDTNYFAASPVTQTFTVAGQSQTITFNALSNKTFGAAPFTVSATSTSGLAVSFSSLTTGICTTSGSNGSTVTLVAGGTCTIAADQAGNGTYGAAAQKQQSFTVLPGAQTITMVAVPSQTRWMPVPPLSATATSGLPVTFGSASPSVCTVNGTTVTIVNTGNCQITANQAGNATYSPAPQSGSTFTVFYNDAAWVRQSVPAKMTVGQTYQVSVTMKNTGNSTWSKIGTYAHRLGSRNPENNSTWGLSRVELLNSVWTDMEVTFTFNVTAPSSPGVYNFQWQMVQEFAGWFGPLTPNVAVEVGSPQTITFPAIPDQTRWMPAPTLSATASSGLAVTYTTTTPGVCSVTSAGVVTILGGGTCTIAADQSGNSSYGAAPQVTRSFVIKTNNAAFVSQTTAPTEVAPGQQFTLNVTMQNTGDSTWTSGGSNPHRLGAQNPQDSTTWTGGRVNLPSSVSPGNSVTFTINATAPTQPGQYNMQWQMVQEQAGWFGPMTPNAQINVKGSQSITFNALNNQALGTTPPALVATATSGLAVTFSSKTATVCSVSGTTMTLLSAGTCTIAANQAGNASYSPAPEVTRSFMVTATGSSAVFDVQTVPTTMRAGQPYTVTVKMINNGSTTWTAVDGFKLGSQNPQDNRIWGTNGRVTVPGSIAPGATATFTFSVTAPSTPGTYNFRWQMMQEGVAWFGALTDNIAVQVTTGAGPTVNLSATPTNVRLTGSTAPVTFTGAGSESGRQILKLELFQDSGSGFTTPVHTVTGAASTLNYNYTANLAAGLYRFKLRATDDAGIPTDSAVLFVNVTNSSLLGQVTGIIQNATQEPQLVGWVCQPGNAAGLNYQVYLNGARDLGGTQLVTGVANVSGRSGDATVQNACGTTGSSHHFVVNLASYTSQYAGSAIYVEAQDTNGNSIVLPCADNNCTMPGSLRIGLTTPTDGKHVAANTPIFLRALMANGSGPYDEVSFSVNGGAWQAGQVDTDPNAYYLSAAGLAARAQPYPVQARVRQGNTTLYSLENMVYVDAEVQTTVSLTAPADGAAATVGSPLSLSATVSGAAAANVTQVKFTAAGSVINASNGGGTWTASWTPAVTGSAAIAATAYDANGVSLGSSMAVNVTVSAGSSSSATPIPVVAAPPAFGAMAGSLPGELSVTQGGAATYSIPIEVPPGTAGVAPKLSLNYSSQGTNGIVGLGWTLGGTSTIHRCGKTIAQDKVNARISFSTNDRLCLDGQRLVRVSGGNNEFLNGTDISSFMLVIGVDEDASYWADGAEYRTEIESFSRIKAHPRPDGGRYFTVEAKDGRIMTYGKSASSYESPVLKAINCSPTATCYPTEKDGALSWKLDTTTDRYGNYVSYAYVQNTSTGEHKLSTIRYGGKNLTSHAAVTFTYEDRKDAWTRFIDQARNDQRTRLASITTYVGSNLDGDPAVAGTWVRKYDIAYEYSPTSGRSLLNKISVSARNPQTGSTDVLPPTTFEWGKPVRTAGFAAPVSWGNGPVISIAKQNAGSVSVTMHPELFSMTDFENHGRIDILQKSTYPLNYDSIKLAREFPASAISLKTSYDYYHNNGSGFDKMSYQLSTGESFGVMDVGDFNGDGAPDLLAWTAGNVAKVCLSPLASTAPSLAAPIIFNCRPSTEYAAPFNPAQPPLVTDIVGDGRSALYGRVTVEGNATLCLQENCQRVWVPPGDVVGYTYADDGSIEYHSHAFTEFTQSVDYGGVGKPYDTRMTRPHFLSKIYSDNDYIGYYKWVNLTPMIKISVAGIPDVMASEAPVASYVYPEYSPLGPFGPPPTQVDLRTPYSFEDGATGIGGSADFNGSGYSGLVFGFREHGWNGGTSMFFNKAEMTLCASTGRELDCHVRKKYSTYDSVASTKAGTYGGTETRMQYLAPVGVGNFIGDGQPNILARSMVQGAMAPTPTGNFYVCRVMGDDNSTAGSNGLDDTNMVCDPWTGANLAGDLTGTNNRVFFFDMLGTGRTQILQYSETRGTSEGDPTSYGWTLSAPIDQAADGQALDRIHSVTNGMASTSKVEYEDALTAGLVSRSGTANLIYPRHLSPGVGKYVRRMVTNNGVGAARSHTYRYQDPALDVSGRGSVGFGIFMTTDEQTNFVTTNTYEQQDWKLSGMLLSSVTRSNNCAIPLSSQVNRLQAREITQVNLQTTYLPLVAGSTTMSADLTCAPLATVLTAGPKGAADVSYDNWGNLLGSDVTTSGDGKTYLTTTENTYKAPDLTNWHTGLLETAKITKSQSGDPKVITRMAYHTYDAITGSLASTTVQPNDNSKQMKLLITFGRANNSFGLIDTKTTTWSDPFTNANQSSIESMVYDGNGRYPTILTNALLQSQSRSYFEGTGLPRSAIDANGLTVNWETDGFGRVTLEKNTADGNEMRTARKQCGGDALCPSGTAMVTVVERFNGGARTAVPQLSFVDGVGHLLRTATFGTDGISGTLAIVVDQHYGDRLGRLSQVDQPRFTDKAAYMAKYMEYDDLNRITLLRVKDEGGANVDTTSVYTQWETTITNAKEQTRKETRDALARLASVRDALGGVTSFTYDAFGNLTATTDPGGNVITVSYDDLGRKIDLKDPDLGQINYLVDARGLVRRQISPNHRLIAGYQSTAPADPLQDKAIRMEYDLLGRMTARFEPDLQSHWIFDKDPGSATGCDLMKSCGQLVEAYTGPATAKDYRRTHTYDSKGRPSTVWQHLFDADYTSTPAYDTWSRPISVTHRRGESAAAAKVFDQRYDAYGTMVRIERQGVKLWEATNWDAAGHALSAKLGNGLVQSQSFNSYTNRFMNFTLATSGGAPRVSQGYSYDKLGNLYTRSWVWEGLPPVNETFHYDELNRIDWSEVTGKTRQSFTYDAMGNIKSKTGVGTYTYPASGATAVRPHAVQSITALDNTETAFTYDANGNRKTANNRTESWTTFDMPDTLTKTIGSTAYSSQFMYGPEHQRTRQKKQLNGVDAGMVIYAGAQEVETVGQVTKVKTYWPMGLGVEIETISNGATTGNEQLWSHKDNLGSPLALTDASGNLQERMAYDVWGKRRTLDGTYEVSGTPTPDSIDGVKDNRGFTGHEMLDQIDLVHMNGRVFDPLIARFLSGDPIIQDPLNGQNYSRYTYVYNNPTNTTDPTGFIGSRIEDEKNERLEREAVKEFNNLSDSDKNKILANEKHAGILQNLSGVKMPSAKNPDTGTKENSASGSGHGVSGSAINEGLRLDPEKVRARENLKPGDYGHIPGAADQLDKNGDSLTFGINAIGFAEGGVGLVRAGPGLWAKFMSLFGKEEAPRIMYHYTTEAGAKAIAESEKLFPSLKAANPKDARYGNGQYLSDIAPGTKSAAQLSKEFLNIPFQGSRFTHYVAIDVRGLNVVQGRAGVYVVPNEGELSLINRIISVGKNAK